MNSHRNSASVSSENHLVSRSGPRKAVAFLPYVPKNQRDRNRLAKACRMFRTRRERRTCTSLTLHRGVPHLVVSPQFGHRSIATAADIYAHLVPDATRAAATAWEAILTSGRNLHATAPPPAP